MRLPVPSHGLIPRLAAIALLATATACAQMPASESMPAATVVGAQAASTDAGAAPTGPQAPAQAASRAAEPASTAVANAAGTVAGPAAVGVGAAVESPRVAPANPAGSAAIDPRTQAERDYDAIYGPPAYNPVADPSLPTPVAASIAFDPWESYNRKMHRFNNFIDRTIARPLARFYVDVVPRPIRMGVRNFFHNLAQPVTMINSLLQGKPKQAMHSLGRFAMNTTLGIVGFFDPATAVGLNAPSEDFGQTLGIWGWERSRYLELPFFGPRTVRDAFGALGDAPLSPLRQVKSDAVRIPLQGLQLVDVRVQLLPTDSLRAGAVDDYALVRDSWLQRRRFQIFGDRRQDGEVALPAYLRDEANPLVPAGAMPVMPTDP